MMKMYIYSLIDPRTNKIFYVGQTKDTHTRLIRHLQESLKGKYPKDSRITELVRLGIMPKINTIEEIEVDQSRKKYETKTSEREKYWIELYSKDNQLDNMQNNKNGVIEDNKKVCLYCGNDYYAFSSKAKYCSTNCRVYWNREKKAVDLLGEKFSEPILKTEPQKGSATEPKQSNSSLEYCSKCSQITIHIGNNCQKCKIPPPPVKEPNEDAIDFAIRKNEWKLKYQ